MDEGWQRAARSEPRDATHGAVDRGIERLARRQKQLVRLDQLVSLGLSPRGVRSRVGRRPLFRVHREVFALHPPPYGDHQRYLAAVYACGPGSALSDLPAAHLLGIFDARFLPACVTNISGAGRSRQGITVHRRPVDRCDLRKRHGIPCTSPARTVIDSAHALGFEGTEDLIMAADSMRILDRARLAVLADAHRGRPGIRHIRSLIGHDPAETRNVNERRMLAICRSFGVTEPLVNHRIDVEGRAFFAEFCWPELSLIVEADSWRWHGGRLASESDADRDQVLSIAGWRVVHFTRDQIKREREQTGNRIVALTRTH